MLHSVIEKAVKRIGAKQWILFVDYAKAYDIVNNNALWNNGVPQHLIWKKLYCQSLQKLYCHSLWIYCVLEYSVDTWRITVTI